MQRSTPRSRACCGASGPVYAQLPEGRGARAVGVPLGLIRVRIEQLAEVSIADFHPRQRFELGCGTSYFVSPIFSLAVDSKEIPRFVMFVLAAVLVGSLGVAQRRRDAVAPEGGGGAARDVGSARARHPGHDDGGAGGLHRP